MNTKIIDIESGLTYDVWLTKSAGEENILCPVCSHLRKREHQKTKCLSWNHDKGTGYCHNQNEKFSLPKQFIQKEYSIPEWKNNTKLSDKVVKWFESRKIEQSELRRMKVSEGIEYMPQREKEVNTIQFNYFRDEKLINIKYRDAAKNFKLFKNAELIFYGLNDIKDKKQIIIVEGEMDKLAFGSVGVFNVVSVPNGASGLKLEYLDNCIEYFDKCDEIILATDEDIPGIKLRNELSSRLGLERCFKVSFIDCKDANEYLIKYGIESLKNVLNDKKPFPIEGVFSSVDFLEDLRLLYKYGLQPGLKIGIPDFDELLTFEPGRVYIDTGIPGHGKSEFLDYIIERLNILHGFKAAYFSPENHPLQLHASKIIEKITGQRFSEKSLPLDEFEDAESYIRNNFYFINPEENFNLESILSKVRQLIKNKGVKILVIDPYNKLEHQRQPNQNETEYISVFMDKITNFARINNIIFFLCAHPRKMNKDASGKHEIPTLYDINGSANFYNKTDFGFCVYRNFDTGFTEIYIQKVKFKHLGQIGSFVFSWDKISGRYFPIINEIITPDTSNHLRTLIYKKEEIKHEIKPQQNDWYNQENRIIDEKEIPF
jgi:twinkle protein